MNKVRILDMLYFFSKIAAFPRLTSKLRFRVATSQALYLWLIHLWPHNPFPHVIYTSGVTWLSTKIIQWLMEPGCLMPHSQGSPIIPILGRNNPILRIDTYGISLRYILILPSHLRLGLPKGLFPAGLHVKILKSILPSHFLATWPANILLNF